MSRAHTHARTRPVTYLFCQSSVFVYYILISQARGQSFRHVNGEKSDRNEQWNRMPTICAGSHVCLHSIDTRARRKPELQRHCDSTPRSCPSLHTSNTPLGISQLICILSTRTRRCEYRRGRDHLRAVLKNVKNTQCRPATASSRCNLYLCSIIWRVACVANVCFLCAHTRTRTPPVGGSFSIISHRATASKAGANMFTFHSAEPTQQPSSADIFNKYLITIYC